MFLKNQRLFKRSHYPTNVNLQMLGQLFEDVTNGVMIWRKFLLRLGILKVENGVPHAYLRCGCLTTTDNHNIWSYREDFLAALLHIQRSVSQMSECERYNSLTN